MPADYPRASRCHSAIVGPLLFGSQFRMHVTSLPISSLFGIERQICTLGAVLQQCLHYSFVIVRSAGFSPLHLRQTEMHFTVLPFANL